MIGAALLRPLRWVARRSVRVLTGLAMLAVAVGGLAAPAPAAAQPPASVIAAERAGAAEAEAPSVGESAPAPSLPAPSLPAPSLSAVIEFDGVGGSVPAARSAPAIAGGSVAPLGQRAPPRG